MEFAAPRTMYGSWFDDNVQAMAAHCRQPMDGFVAESLRPLPDSLSSGELARTFASYLIAANASQWEEALPHARRAFELAPGISRTTGHYRTTSFLVASQHEERGELQAAAQVYREHLELDREFLGVWLNLALLEVKLSKPEEALRLLEQVEGQTGEYADQISLALTELRKQVVRPVRESGSGGPR
jgi:tetratricopeptide (TPR) repeat protein